jgi:hypothetical protein
MKKNNKGFVLAEAIIVSVFVLGMFTYLAMNVIPLISRYERVVNYDNPQEIYLANTLYEEMLNVENNTNINSDIVLSVLVSSTSEGEKGLKLTCVRVTPNEKCTGSPDFYEELGKALKIEAIYTYDTGKDCGDIENDKGLKNYCEYYIKRKIGEEKNITKAFMIKFSGDKENISGNKENNSDKAVNKKYATIVVPQ